MCRGRDRYVNEEFDLDLTYITERIIGKLFCVHIIYNIIIMLCSTYIIVWEIF